MLSDHEMMRLRMAFLTAGIGITDATDVDLREAWGNSVFEAGPENLRALMIELRGTRWEAPLRDVLLEISFQSAGDILNGVGLPVADVRDRRWQLRRELARVVDTMSLEQLQRLVYWSKAIVQ